MTRRMFGCLLALGLGICLTPGTASAQLGFPNQSTNPYVRPAVSPYVNLTRPGNIGVNYYGQVKPQIDFNRSIFTLQQNQQQIQQSLLTQLGTPTEDESMFAGYSITGHPTAFFNQAHYFGQLGVGNGIRPVQPPTSGFTGLPVRR